MSDFTNLDDSGIPDWVDFKPGLIHEEPELMFASAEAEPYVGMTQIRADQVEQETERVNTQDIHRGKTAAELV